MRQAIHIFRKDVRLLGFEILVALLMALAFTWTIAGGAGASAASPVTESVAAELLTYLLPLTWWILIARVIYNETLPGDRQFWLTRPYSRKSLLLAKVLFLVAFVNLPKLISDGVILKAYGFHLGTELAGLLWSQLLLTAAFIVPIAAICTVTTGFVQLLSVSLGLGAVIAIWNLAMPALGGNTAWLGLEWIRSYAMGIVVAIGALGMIFLQYFARKTMVSRGVAAGVIALVLLTAIGLPWASAFGLQSRFSKQPVDDSAVQVHLNAGQKATLCASLSENGATLTVPIRITGVPTSLRPQMDGVAVTIEGPGATWHMDPQPWNSSRETSASLDVHVNSSFYQQMKDSPVRVRGSVYLTLYGNERSSFISHQRRAELHPTPGLGLCSLTQTTRGYLVGCRSTFRSRPDLVSIDFAGPGRQGQMMSFLTLSYSRLATLSYSPFPADPNLMPVALSARHAELHGALAGVAVRAIEPVAHIRRDFESTGVRFSRCETRPGEFQWAFPSQ